MKLFQRLFFAAVIAGLVAGAAMSVVQLWQVTPLILEAEAFEILAPAELNGHDASPWAPRDGLERTAYTVLANLLVSVGFALVVAAVSVFSGLEITARNGVVWGLVGFGVFQLAPAFGLPPELPGMAAAELGARQLWWWATALSTGAAALLIAKYRSWPAVVAVITLIALPHLVGAPAAPDEATTVPAQLAATFTARALGTGALFWLGMAPLLGWLNERLARSIVISTREAQA